MIELLVVIIIIGILISSILVAGSALITRSKINNTKATIQVVLDACEEFKHEQAAATRGSLTTAQQDQSGRRWSATAKFVADPDGGPSFWQGVIVDVTARSWQERREVLERLSASGRRTAG
jgi:type II secretory pathway pseudopilin PulG